MTSDEATLARAFSRASGAKKVNVDITDDELISVVADGKRFEMEIGSDDDGFKLVARDGTTVCFPFRDGFGGGE